MTLTTRVTGWDQPPLQIMQMMYFFINNIHVDYAELLWEGLHYSLHHPTSLIPYPRFTKIIISHYKTNFPEISRRTKDTYHNLKDDDIMKNIFNLGRHKDRVGMKIPDWMISEEMKHIENYRMYVEQEARENVELVNKHLASEEIEKMVDEPENVIDDSPIPRNDDQNIPGTRLEPKSDKDSRRHLDDDETPTKQVSQDIMEEVSQTINEAELKKIADEMLRQRCTSGDEHQYHIDLMKNFLKNDIVWESRKEILASSHLQKTTPLVQSYPRDPEAPALSLINQDLLCVNKCVKKFNPYAQYGVEHWKNPHAKIFYIKRQKEPGKPKEVVYLNSKIIQVFQEVPGTGHEHKFISQRYGKKEPIITVSITESDYKNLNKNDIEDMYLLIMNGKVPDYAETCLMWSLSVFIRSSVIWERVHDIQLGIESYQQKVNLTAPTIYFPGIEKHKMFSIVYEPVHEIIYKNSKKEKRVM
ncbi:hypothetical protein Tco_1346762 [Tanacetum coccineum]